MLTRKPRIASQSSVREWTPGGGPYATRGGVTFQSVDRRTHECYWCLSRQRHLDGWLRDHQSQNWEMVLLASRRNTDPHPLDLSLGVSPVPIDSGIYPPLLRLSSTDALKTEISNSQTDQTSKLNFSIELIKFPPVSVVHQRMG